MLRKVYKSKLPAQIYHFPSERPAADSELVKEALSLGATLVEAVGSTKDEKRRKNVGPSSSSLQPDRRLPTETRLASCSSTISKPSLSSSVLGAKFSIWTLTTVRRRS